MPLGGYPTQDEKGGNFSIVLYYHAYHTAEKGEKVLFVLAGFCSVFVRVFAGRLPIELFATDIQGSRTFTIEQRRYHDNEQWQG
jgi:hypothetical protein